MQENRIFVEKTTNYAFKQHPQAKRLELDLRGFGFLDWSQWQPLIEKGYLQTATRLKDMPLEERFWG